MNTINKILSVEEQKELANDYEFIELRDESVYIRRIKDYLPNYVKEAMRKNGVIRTADGKFVKISR